MVALIDPFNLKIDDESAVRTTADVAEGQFSHISWSDFGDYCPVTLIE